MADQLDNPVAEPYEALVVAGMGSTAPISTSTSRECSCRR